MCKGATTAAQEPLETVTPLLTRAKDLKASLDKASQEPGQRLTRKISKEDFGADLRTPDLMRARAESRV